MEAAASCTSCALALSALSRAWLASRIAAVAACAITTRRPLSSSSCSWKRLRMVASQVLPSHPIEERRLAPPGTVLTTQDLLRQRLIRDHRPVRVVAFEQVGKCRHVAAKAVVGDGGGRQPGVGILTPLHLLQRPPAQCVRGLRL